jgi:hypothetical protein
VPPPGEASEGGSLGDRVTLRVRRDTLPRVREILSAVAGGAEGAFALGLDADPEANARLVWEPGDDGVNTVTPASGDASCLTVGFLAVVFGPDLAGGGRVVEDGFAVTLDREPWQRLRDALTGGEPVALPAAGPGDLGLSVEWVDSGPPGGVIGVEASGFRVESMLLYQPDEVLRERVPSVSSVAEYVKRLEAGAAAFWGARPAGAPQAVLVVAAVRPGGRVRVWVEVPAGLGTEGEARECARRLERVPGPVVQHGPVAVALRASLWGGRGEWPVIPKEWQDAVAGVGTALIPDGILERVWPGGQDDAD